MVTTAGNPSNQLSTMVALQNETTSEQYARICADIKGALDVSADTKDEFLQELDPSYLKQQDNFESMDSKSDKSNYHSSSTVATATEARIRGERTRKALLEIRR